MVLGGRNKQPPEAAALVSRVDREHRKVAALPANLHEDRSRELAVIRGVVYDEEDGVGGRETLGFLSADGHGCRQASRLSQKRSFPDVLRWSVRKIAS